VNYSSGYQGLGVMAVVFGMLLLVATWSCWISHCEKQGLNKFDKAIGVEHVEKGN
jgi:hypothetical protein